MATIETKEIRGIGLKQIVAYTTFLVGASLIYFSIRSETLRNREETIKNRELMQEFKAEWKEQQRFTDLQIREMQQVQRLFEIRLTVLETQLKISKP